MKKIIKVLLLCLILGSLPSVVYAETISWTKVVPKIVSVKAKNYQSVQITWEPVEDADSYIVYYSSDTPVSWKSVKANIKGNTYLHISNEKNPIITGKKYLYTVRAVKNGTKSSYEKKGKTVTPALGTVGLNKVNSINYNKLEITWEKLPGADGYLIYRKENNKWVRIGKANASATSFVHTSSSAHKIKTGTTYTYTVKAYRKTANGTVYSKYSKTGISGKSAYVSGWYEENGSTYYYADKKKATGWKKIDGKMYYFSTVGKLQKDKIVGNASDGYWYVDTTGVQVTDSVVVKAVKLITTLTDSSWSADKKLRTCFDYFVQSCEYERAYDAVDISKMPSYAEYMFTNKCGNCYRGSAALAYCAKVLGFETRMAVGAVSAVTYDNFSAHGWVEIKKDGKWYMSDISFQRRYLDVNLYRILPENHLYRLRVDDHYDMVAKDGKISWK